jgi:hypothetical protein
MIDAVGGITSRKKVIRSRSVPDRCAMILWFPLSQLSSRSATAVQYKPDDHPEQSVSMMSSRSGI